MHSQPEHHFLKDFSVCPEPFDKLWRALSKPVLSLPNGGERLSHSWFDRLTTAILIMAPLPSFRHGCRNPAPKDGDMPVA